MEPVSTIAPEINTCIAASCKRRSRTPDRDAVLEEWSREVRVTIRGIDGQAKRRTHRSHFQGQTEEIIDGYELNTGLWHKLLGLLATCPSPEGTLKNAAPQVDNTRADRLHLDGGTSAEIRNSTDVEAL